VCPPVGYRPIPAVSLALEPANITAVANDVGTEVIFLRQLIAQARPGDMAVGISTSGGSRNIVMALEEARKRTLTTVALLGYDGGEVLRRGLADFPIVVRSDYIPRIQEVQASIYHILREAMETIPLCSPRQPGTRKTPETARDRWERSSRTRGACSTCWATPPNGCRTGMATIITRKVPRPIQPGLARARIAFIAEGVGSSLPNTAGPRLGSSISR